MCSTLAGLCAYLGCPSVIVEENARNHGGSAPDGAGSRPSGPRNGTAEPPGSSARRAAFDQVMGDTDDPVARLYSAKYLMLSAAAPKFRLVESSGVMLCLP